MNTNCVEGGWMDGPSAKAELTLLVIRNLITILLYIIVVGNGKTIEKKETENLMK